MLPKRHRRKVRALAAEHWNSETSKSLYGNKLTDEAVERASSDMASYIRSNRERVFESGIITSIIASWLMKLAVEYAIKLLLKWIDDRMFNGVQPGENPQPGEPEL